jgi:dihydroneopterin aldolase/2-amino-4-hydroxy-6-hydroxymethyldihydropteridine diphosphokinase
MAASITAFVAVGSNIRPEVHVPQAIRLLAARTRVRGVSTIYRTKPLDRPGQPLFYNCAVEIETSIPPLELKSRILRRIEEDLGRKRTGDKYAPRTIDLDLVLYGDRVVVAGDLTLPDPEILRRPFLAVPLFELAPTLRLPGSGRSIKDVAEGMDRSGMEPVARLTRDVKRSAAGRRSGRGGAAALRRGKRIA